MTYGDMYDDWLVELYQSSLDTVPFLRHVSAAKLMKEHDPVGYRCGFADFIEGLMDTGVKCSCCDDHSVDKDRIYRSDSEDEVLCGVCAGDEFECESCGEILEESEESEEEEGVCQGCYDQRGECGGDSDE